MCTQLRRDPSLFTLLPGTPIPGIMIHFDERTSKSWPWLDSCPPAPNLSAVREHVLSHASYRWCLDKRSAYSDMHHHKSFPHGACAMKRIKNTTWWCKYGLGYANFIAFNCVMWFSEIIPEENVRQFFEIQALPCLATTSDPGVDSRWLTKKSIYRRRQYSLRWPWTYCRALYVTMNEEQALVLWALQVSISLGPLFAKSKFEKIS